MSKPKKRDAGKLAAACTILYRAGWSVDDISSAFGIWRGNVYRALDDVLTAERKKKNETTRSLPFTERSVRDMWISARTQNLIKLTGVSNIGELIKRRDEIVSSKGWGALSIGELDAVLAALKEGKMDVLHP